MVSLAPLSPLRQVTSYEDAVEKIKAGPGGAAAADDDNDDDDNDDDDGASAAATRGDGEGPRRPSQWAGLKVGLAEKMAAVRAARAKEAARQGAVTSAPLEGSGGALAGAAGGDS